MFVETYEDYLKKYIELKNGIPSHDTITCVIEMIESEVLQQLYGKWQELFERNEGETLKRLSVSMEKRCVPMGTKTKKPIILYSSGAKKMDFALAQKQWKKK